MRRIAAFNTTLYSMAGWKRGTRVNMNVVLRGSADDRKSDDRKSGFAETHQQSRSFASNGDTQPKHKYYIPRAERTPTHTVYKIDEAYDDRLFRKDRTSPTRELNFTPQHWSIHKSPYRRLRHISQFFGSSPFQRLLFPDMFLVGSVASFLTYYNEFIATDPASQIGLTGATFTGTYTAIGILAAFRVNASYGRYMEARTVWGQINNVCRNLAGQAFVWLPLHSAKRMARLIKAFPVALNFHLTTKGDYHQIKLSDPNFHQQIHHEFKAELKDVWTCQGENEPIDPTIDQDYVTITEAFLERRHTPLQVATCMRDILDPRQLNNVSPIFIQELDRQIQTLVDGMGACERILRTPIPTSFTRHSSRIFFLWAALLPFAAYPTMGAFGTLPASLILSYALMGIEDVGVQLEEPFNILPLRQFSEGIADGVDSIQQTSRKGWVERSSTI